MPDIENGATVGADRTTVYVNESVGIFFKVHVPATTMAFKLHYDPNVFRLDTSALECSFTQYYLDTDTVGVLNFRGSCTEDKSKASTTVRFAFQPKMATEGSKFTLTDVYTAPISTVTIPTVTITVKPLQIVPAGTMEMKDDNDN